MFKHHIHKEGRASIAWVSILLILLGLATVLSGKNLWGVWLLFTACFILWVAVISFFRIPQREYSEADSHSVISPADGTIVDISETEEPEYFKDLCTKISIFMSPTNVHVNRYPVSGKVVYCRYHPGKFLVAWHEKSSEMNERNTVVLRTEKGTDVLVRQIAGAIARRIVSYAEVGKEVRAVQELGFIKFGSRVDLFFPVGTRVCVDVEQKVKGGITVLAELTEEELPDRY